MTKRASAGTGTGAGKGGRERAATGAFDAADLDELGIRSVCNDSRRLLAGDTFLAYPGAAADGRAYIAEAIAKGAATVLWDPDGFTWNPRWAVANRPVPGLRLHVGAIAARVYGNPSGSLWMIGVTGTNGKTSCSQWIAEALTRCGRKTAVIGTLGVGMPGALEPSPNTTPDAVFVNERLADFVSQGIKGCSMEVSSHALAQDRLSDLKFDVGMLTNLTRDHLDYHGTIRSYKASKARLFRNHKIKIAVLNFDDAFGAELGTGIKRRGLEILGYGFTRTTRRRPAVYGHKLEVDARGVAFEIESPWGKARLVSPLIGRFNALNLLGSLTAIAASGVGLEQAVRALATVRSAPGRMQRLGGGARPTVVIDYAHSPDAMEQVLASLREALLAGAPPPAALGGRERGGWRIPIAASLRGPRLICVFGCGGERDRGKRPLMGKVASRLADSVIVTSDNPRGEDPRAIIHDIVAGIEGPYRVEPDRAEAIRIAVESARRGDVVVIAGKGHETYQEVHGERRPFSDVDVALQCLEDAGGA
jgi:UDP-N-acetylmuramoyl-L-alanyl-D-glutamate--2,6-diaminopimelate ligase